MHCWQIKPRQENIFSCLRTRVILGCKKVKKLWLGRYKCAKQLKNKLTQFDMYASYSSRLLCMQVWLKKKKEKVVCMLTNMTYEHTSLTQWFETCAQQWMSCAHLIVSKKPQFDIWFQGFNNASTDLPLCFNASSSIDCSGALSFVQVVERRSSDDSGRWIAKQ